MHVKFLSWIFGLIVFFFWKIWKSSRAHLAPKLLSTPPFLKNILLSRECFLSHFWILFEKGKRSLFCMRLLRSLVHALPFRMRTLRGPVHNPFSHAATSRLCSHPFPTQKGSRLSRKKNNNNLDYSLRKVEFSLTHIAKLKKPERIFSPSSNFWSSGNFFLGGVQNLQKTLF